MQEPITLSILAEASWTLVLGVLAAGLGLLSLLLFIWFVWRMCQALAEDVEREEAERDEAISQWMSGEPADRPAKPDYAAQITPAEADRIQAAERNEENIRRSGGY